jgi:threonine synthase
VCGGCGAEVPADRPFVFRCPAARPADDIDHVLRRILDPALVQPPDESASQPFARYRGRLHAWHAAMAAGWSDERFVALVRELDEAVARVEGHGFGGTPLVRAASLDRRLGLQRPAGLWVKDETGNVSGSHKARHLFGVMLALRVAESLGQADPEAPLAIASCGNAALAAAVVARAAGRRLVVFVPPTAPASVLARLGDLEAQVETCERTPGQAGDPTYLRLVEAVEAGEVPFTVQGNLQGLASEGGATLGWELLDQLAEHDAPALDRLVIHVGGGAFATGLALACEDALALGRIDRLPRIDTVQTRGGYPLARAHGLVLTRLGAEAGVPLPPDRVAAGLSGIARHRSAYMWPWETEPVSIAHGILDDETYDWLAVVRAMLLTGGRSVVVDEVTLEEANALALPELGIDADHTGTAGLAGLISLTRDGLVQPDETVAVIFSGVRRPSAAPTLQPAQALQPTQGGIETP